MTTLCGPQLYVGEPSRSAAGHMTSPRQASVSFFELGDVCACLRGVAVSSQYKASALCSV